MKNKMKISRLGVSIAAILGLSLNIAVAKPLERSDQVVVTLNDEIQLTWDEPLRLRQVLEEIANHHELSDVHWPSARLVAEDFDLNLETKRAAVLRGLEELALEWQGDLEKQRAVNAVAQQIRGWKLGPQPVAGISLEAARQRINDNPLLPAGRYTLYTPPRIQGFHIFGLVAQPGAYQLESGQTVMGYLNALRDTNRLLWGVNRESAEVIEVSGEVRTAHWGLHNAGDDELLPQEILWLGFSNWALPKHLEKLDDAVTELLAHYIPTEAAPSSLNILETQPTTANHWSRMNRQPTRGHNGNIGLLQTPTARMAESGDISFTYSYMDEYHRYSVNLQVLSWLEATGWYTRFPNRRYSPFPNFSTEILTDKGFDVKARVWKETYFTPEVSIGLRDFAGTGIFDGEFIVANKQLGAFDLSLGVGFGRTGASDNISNPFCEISDRFCERDGSTSGRGGQAEYSQWFRGPAALFGGVEWQTPHEPLRVKLEYDGNDYSGDNAGVPIEPKTQWNIGLSYDVTNWFNIQTSYERGDTLMFNFTLRNNFNTMRQVRVERPKVEPQEARTESLDDVNWTRMRRDFRRQHSFASTRFNTPDEETVIASVYPFRYRDMNEAVDRASRVLAAEVPETVKNFEFVHMSIYEPSFSTRVDADAFRARINNEELDKSVHDTGELFVRTSPAELPDREDESWRYNPETRYRASYGLRPFFNQDFGAPEDFMLYQLGVGAFVHRPIVPKLEVFAEVGVNIHNNYDFNFRRTPDALPTVRTDVREYVSNDVWLENLQLNYYERLTDGLYGFVYGGYLERMFAGVGGELLWRPLDSPWAFGLDINRVRQRDFEGWWGTQNYEVTTGFASVYYQMPWLEDTSVQLDVGRFLAGDKGVRVTFQKRFDSGMIAGAYASFTNVSSEEYGEGSFTKGFYLAIPFDLLAILPSREFVSFGWVPLARNGGQPLHRRFRLYDMTDDRSPFFMRDTTTRERRR